MFREMQNAGVPYLVSTLLPCPHGFSVRAGGVSEAPHLASMNFAVSRGDAPENVRENHRRFTAAVGLPQKIAAAAQVHGVRILPIEKSDADALDALPPDRMLPEADGFVTGERGVCLCVKVADCVPLLLADEEAGVIAALHAGWRGSAAGIALRGVEAMIAQGARREKILCAMGPSIHACCFEAREDLAMEFRKLLGPSTAARFLRRKSLSEGPERESGPRYLADLQGLNRHFLLEAGLLPAHIDISPACSCCRPDRFFSHRATGGRRGVMAAMIARG